MECVWQVVEDPWLKKKPAIIDALVAVVEPETAGDPMSEQLWTRTSLTQIQESLESKGFALSTPTIAAILVYLGYSPKANQKRLEGASHPDRDLQFRYIKQVVDAFTLAGLPIISVDTKKKELIGNFKNAGQCWSKEAISVNVHDFPQDAQGKAVPYGIYLPHSKEGVVYIGNSADTSEFAVDCIKTWWSTQGRLAYPTAEELLIVADSGGSNSCRYHLWKDQLQEKMGNELGLKVTVCHYPTGCSKWNPIEHRLFGPISVNWAGEPLQSFEKMMALINRTKTEAGLKVKAVLMDGVYKTGIKVSEAAIEALHIMHHLICPLWNYTIAPVGADKIESKALANIGDLFF